MEKDKQVKQEVPSIEELEECLGNIMKNIHEQGTTYGEKDGYIDYVKGANIAGFIKIADAMLACGVILASIPKPPGGRAALPRD